MELTCPIGSQAAGLTAVVGPKYEVTYGELDRLVAGTSARLLGSGLAKGDRMALVLENGLDAVVLLFAAFRVGIAACPLSTRLPADAAAERAAAIGARVLVADRPISAAVDPEAFIEKGRGAARPIEEACRATIIFTSGSTGRPRAAAHSLGNHHYSALGSNENIRLGPGDRWLLSLPLYHVGGLAILFRCFQAGAAVAIPPAEASLIDSVRTVTHASMVATQLRRLLKAPSDTVYPTKALLLGGSAIPASLIDEATVRGLPVHTSYGMTETASQATATPPGASRDDLATAGRVLPHREVAVDRGRIKVRGRTLFEGYLEGGRIQRPFDEDGWFTTGDLGRFDEHDRLIVTGRADNLFISGGENIHPEAIEAALSADPAIERVVVVPVDDEEYGRRPVAFVEISGKVDTARLRSAVEQQLPRFMVPDAFYSWPDDADMRGMKIDRAWFERRATELRRG